MKNKIKSFFGDSKNKIWFVLNIVCSVVYLLWRIFFTIPIGYGVVSLIAGILLLFVETLGLVEALVHYINMYNARDYVKPDVPEDLFPDVDIFIATYNEEPELLKKTLLACKRMDYPDKNKVHIYLCDDGHRDSMKELAAKLKVNYLDREDHKGQKAGNLNNALAHSSSPYVVTFDADMIPQSGFLMETMPYFVDAELRNRGREEKDKIKLGFLQTPQSFYDVDLFQFNLHSEGKIPNEQDYFYRDIEVARTRTNSCIYGGSNTVISREALEKIGGFYTGAITEDFATGILIEKAGFVSLGIAKRLASGISAKNLQDLIQQRVRWARGVISTGRKMHIYTSKDLSFAQKINYWASIWYWYAPIKRLSYIMSPILYATFGFMVFRCDLWQVLLFWLPMYVTSNISLKMLSGNIRNTKWTSIYEYALFPYMLIPVILESFGFSLKKFKVTTKEIGNNKSRGKNIIYMIPILILILLSVVGIVRCILVMFDSGSFGPIVVLFWLVYNLYSMIMCLFFVDGRDIYRKAERVYATVEGTLETDGKMYSCVTKDMSETGVALYLDNPILLDPENKVKTLLTLDTGRWVSKMWVIVKHTKEIPERKEKKWLYALEIESFYSEEDYDSYLAVLYDRIPTNPSEIKKTKGVYDDLKTNIELRVTTAQYLKRQLPRMIVGKEIPVIVDGEEKLIHLLDFNYQYFSTYDLCGDPRENENKNDSEDRPGDSEPQKVIFKIGKYQIPASFEREVKHAYLYRIDNFDELYFEEKKRDEIMYEVLDLIKKKSDETKKIETSESEAGSSNKSEEFDEMKML